MREELNRSNEDGRAHLRLILEQVVRRRTAGEHLSDAEVLAEFPDHAQSLVIELSRLRRIQFAGEKAVAWSDDATESGAADGTPDDSGRLAVRCPSCHSPMEVAVDTSLTDLTCGSCGSHFSLVSETLATAPVLSSLGRFELLTPLGAGGFGTVWKARDRELDRFVAIKLPRREAMDAEETEKFIREARAAAQLRHPNIVCVHEVGREDGRLFLVSDYVDGIGLHDWLTAQQPTNREAAELCSKIAVALHHAHEQGVVHRDLKPANVLLDLNGEPHLTDFGLARRMAGEVTMTVDGQVLGTPAYMSPEQARGEAHTADGRSDVYSLGVILFQLLTGELPFRGNARMLFFQVIHDEPPSPRKLNASVPRDLETIALKCLEKAPAGRYQTALEVAEELDRFRQGEPILARPIGKLQLGWRWCRRNRAVATVASVVVLLLATLAGVTTTAYLREQGLRRDTDRARSMAEFRLAENQVHRGMDLAEEGDVSAGLLWLVRSLRGEHDMPPHMRRLVRMKIGSLSDQVFARPQAIYDFKYGMSTGGVSPDGSLIAIGFTDGSIYLVSPDKVEQLSEKYRDEMNDAVFSPDGTKLATTSIDGTARIWDVATRTPIGAALKHRGRVEAAAFSPNSAYLVTGDSSGSTRLWDASSGHELYGPAYHGGGWVLDVAFTSDGNSILCADGGNLKCRVSLWNATADEPEGVTFETPHEIDKIAVSPRANVFATGDRGGVVRFWDVSSGKELRNTVAHRDWICDVSYNRDGTLLLTASRDGLAKLLDAESGSQIGGPIPHLRYVRNAAFIGDERLLTLADGRTVVWKLHLPAPPEPLLTLDHKSSTVLVAFSADASRLITASSAVPKVPIWDASVVKTWDCKNGKLLNTFTASRGKTSPAAFNPAGSSMLAVTRARDSSCVLLDADSGKPLSDAIQVGGIAADVAVHPQGASFLATMNSSDAQLWNLATGQKVGPLMRHPRKCGVPAFSPDGTVVATPCWDGLVRFWDTTTGQSAQPSLDCHVDLNAMAFSGDGKRIATVAVDKTVSVWDLDSVRRISGPLKHAHDIWRVAFSPNGEFVAVASGDWERTAPGEAAVTVWSVPLGRMVARWEHPHHVTSVVFRPDGNAVASSCLDGKVRVWAMPQPMPGDPELLEAWAEVLTGMRFESSGGATHLDSKSFEQQKRRFQQLGGRQSPSSNDRASP